MKGVLFDFWGTLVDNGLNPSPVKQAYKMFNLGIPFKDFIVRFEEAFMTGDSEDLYEAFRRACEEFDVEPRKRFLDSLVGMQNKNDMLAKPYPETFDVLESLKSDGYKLGMVSNTPSSIRRVLEKFDMEKYFDSIVLSCDEGVLKTDPELFEKILGELGLEEDEVIMVGDSMHTDMEGAEKAGVKGVLIDRRDSRDYENKITSLRGVYEYL